MKYLFTVKGAPGAPAVGFEQDVTVTRIQKRNVSVQPGDVVRVLAEATVEQVYGDGQHEVILSTLQPVKIVSVQRK